MNVCFYADLATVFWVDSLDFDQCICHACQGSRKTEWESVQDRDLPAHPAALFDLAPWSFSEHLVAQDFYWHHPADYLVVRWKHYAASSRSVALEYSYVGAPVNQSRLR